MNVTSSQISFKARVKLNAQKAASKFLEPETKLAECKFQEPNISRIPKVLVKMFDVARFVAAPFFARNEVKSPLKNPGSACLSVKKPPLRFYLMQKIENVSRDLFVPFRKSVGLSHSKANSEQIDLLHKEVMPLEAGTSKYSKLVTYISHVMGNNREVEINLESGRIANIVDSDESCIFIMNHDNHQNDPSMVGIFNSFLQSEYLKAGKGDKSPDFRVLMSKDVFSFLGQKLQGVLSKLGFVDVDASIFPSKEGCNSNTRKILPVVKDFLQDKANIFIFPEGRMSIFKSLDISERFQSGIADIIQRATAKKERVKVVPVGFAFNEKTNPVLGSIHIGEPVFFKRDGENILTSKGNMASDFVRDTFARFFEGMDKDSFRSLIAQGKTVKNKESAPYIAGILCENLRVCREEAKKALPQSSLGDKVIDVA